MKKEKNKESACALKRKTSIGGQALIEGIMMRGPKKTAMAVRDPNGEIVFEEWENKASAATAVKKIPIVRGVVAFVDSMATGYKCLMRSAELSGLEEAERELEAEKAAKKARKAAAKESKRSGRSVDEILRENAEKEAAETTEKDKGSDEKKGSSPFTVGFMVVSILIAVLLMVVLFIWLPTTLFGLLTRAFPVLLFPDVPALASLLKSVFEGLFKIVLLVGYMALVSLMKDIRRTFEYHGAEHKTIFCYEHGRALTVENVRNERRFHPRCGTSFLILMVLVSIFVCFFIDPVAILVSGKPLVGWLRTVVRLVLLPIIMGLGYEVLKFAGRHENLFTRVISAPGMWLQRITVREPDDGMIECAIKAFVAVIPENELPEEKRKIREATGETEATAEESDGESAEASVSETSEEPLAEETEKRSEENAEDNAGNSAE